KKSFPFLTYIIWSSNWLNEMATLQLLRNFFVIEIELGSEAAVFSEIKKTFPAKTFLNPTEIDWIQYISAQEEAIVIKTIISESPKTSFNGIKIAKLEKILVDLYSDKLWNEIFASEIETIYIEACSSYALNFATI